MNQYEILTPLPPIYNTDSFQYDINYRQTTNFRFRQSNISDTKKGDCGSKTPIPSIIGVLHLKRFQCISIQRVNDGSHPRCVTENYRIKIYYISTNKLNFQNYRHSFRIHQIWLKNIFKIIESMYFMVSEFFLIKNFDIVNLSLFVMSHHQDKRYSCYSVSSIYCVFDGKVVRQIEREPFLSTLSTVPRVRISTPS